MQRIGGGDTYDKNELMHTVGKAFRKQNLIICKYNDLVFGILTYCVGRLEFFRYRKEVRVDGDSAVDQ